ncbi:retron St85 family effector protein [Azospirillum sp. YIM DDC1]|uniref:Retron St85 family effector protein n=1 Tax=Azospirillum aestuarii TaxID=2802052 RepID=A0ABS1I9V4_9PROT|nr:retron St85 family effector protein [Azospirillum aestuarii]MBK4723488.1 retron St85 family effector protein [Azospirillum aestuarii]
MARRFARSNFIVPTCGLGRWLWAIVEDRSARWPKAIFRVLKGKQLLPYAEDIDVERIHVKEPFDVILLCGGQYGDIGDPTPKSLRDAFLKAFPPPKAINNLELIQAEEITKQFDFRKNYDDILMFETDIAQIVRLIILFCESEGSLAELGAFAVIDEIMNRLFVVIRENHWNEPSFIKLGPLQRISREVGREAIHVVADDDVGLNGKSATSVDKKKLVEMLDGPLEQRLSATRDSTTFDQGRAGHVIKLIVGLVQEYGALTAQEISWILKLFNTEKSDNQIRGYLLCAISVGWLTCISKGSKDYYVQTSLSVSKGIDAAVLPMKEGAKEMNKSRRRLAIRQHWMEKDKLRFAAIQQASKGM